MEQGNACQLGGSLNALHFSSRTAKQYFVKNKNDSENDHHTDGKFWLPVMSFLSGCCVLRLTYLGCGMANKQN